MILSITAKVLLSQLLDPPGTLIINNRYVSMAPRGLACVVIMCLPFIWNIPVYAFMGAVSGVVMPVIPWEYFAAHGQRLIRTSTSRLMGWLLGRDILLTVLFWYSF
jgi:hypothetical protein